VTACYHTRMPKPYTETDLLQHALVGLEHRKKEITEALSRLQRILGGTVRARSAPSTRKRRTMSAAGRKRLALSMRRRWAKVKKAGKKRLE
jgi:hypothetical protein